MSHKTKETPFICRNILLSFLKSQLSEQSELWKEAKEGREALIDKASDLDDTLAGIILERESLDRIGSDELQQALRRITIARVFHFNR